MSSCSQQVTLKLLNKNYMWLSLPLITLMNVKIYVDILKLSEICMYIVMTVSQLATPPLLQTSIDRAKEGKGKYHLSLGQHIFP